MATLTLTFTFGVCSMIRSTRQRFLSERFWVAAGAAVGLVCLSVFVNAAPDRARTENRGDGDKRDIKDARPARVIGDSQDRLTFGYMVGAGEVWVNMGNDTIGQARFRVETGADALPTPVPVPVEARSINPEDFVRMSGTRQGMAALTRAVAAMLADEELTIRPLTVPGGAVPSQVEGIALFEGDAGVTHLLIARYENESWEFHQLSFMSSGCTATVPQHTCSCNATGAGAQCSSGTDSATGTHWAKCKDAPAPSATKTNCSGKGGSCSCLVTAAQ